MALVNYATREINAKIVYYGPGLSGKTTNIHHVFERIKLKNKGKLISLATQGDRTLFFDFLPVELGSIRGFNTRFHLYTVPGQVFYNSTRKLVLKGADGVVFVADSQKMMMDENLQSMENLKSNLADMGLKLDKFPVVIQYNKRDLPNAAPVEEMNEYLNPLGLPYFEASAATGEGVLKTMTAIVKFIMHDLNSDPKGHDLNFEVFRDNEPELRAAEAAPAVPQPVAAAEPAPASRESVWADEVPPAPVTAPEPAPAVMEYAAPAVSAPESPDDITETLHMPPGWDVDAQAAAPAEVSSELSGNISMPSGVMDARYGPAAAREQESAGTVLNFPPVVLDMFAAPGVAEHEHEEIYEAVEVPEELGEAIKDDVSLPMAGLGDEGLVYTAPGAEGTARFDERESALFSELAEEVHAEPAEAVHEAEPLAEDGQDVFERFAAMSPAMPPQDAPRVCGSAGMATAGGEGPPIAWEAAIHDAEEFVEEEAQAVAEAAPAEVPAGDKDLFDVYFGRKAAKPSMSVEELDSELAHEFEGDVGPEPETAEQPVMGSRQVFTIPVRITTTDGLREVTLKVSVDVEIEGAGLDSITKVEVLQPYPKADSSPSVKPADEARLKPPDTPRPVRPPAPILMPKAEDKKFSVLQKILGMK